MRYSLYVLAIVLIIAWAIGYFGTNIGSIIHILLVFAAIALLIMAMDDEKLAKNFKIKL